MLIFAFCILMILVFGRIGVFAFKAAWGITKILLTIVFLPFILIFMVIGGLMSIAFPILIVIGIITFIAALAAK